MRTFLALMIALVAIDFLAFDGRFSQAAWHEAKDQARHLNYYLSSIIKKAGI